MVHPEKPTGFSREGEGVVGLVSEGPGFESNRGNSKRVGFKCLTFAVEII